MEYEIIKDGQQTVCKKCNIKLTFFIQPKIKDIELKNILCSKCQENNFLYNEKKENIFSLKKICFQYYKKNIEIKKTIEEIIKNREITNDEEIKKIISNIKWYYAFFKKNKN